VLADLGGLVTRQFRPAFRRAGGNEQGNGGGAENGGSCHAAKSNDSVRNLQTGLQPTAKKAGYGAAPSRGGSGNWISR